MPSILHLLITDSNAETLSIIHSFIIRKEQSIKSSRDAVKIANQLKLFEKGTICRLLSKEELSAKISKANTCIIFKHIQKYLIAYFVLQKDKSYGENDLAYMDVKSNQEFRFLK